MGKNRGNLDLVCEKKVSCMFHLFLYPYLYLFRRCYINKYDIFHAKEGKGMMLCLWSGQPEFNCWISFTLVFSCIYC